ncbi:hypothetical protein [Mycobacterium sp. 360MFTsu5.1]|uniref:hypothetical protein n=1 Tax=Mycobacterium sp. 360MFTsu5.1 TaxID=1172186 RepID=UPI00039D9C8B|nr:hypothetical protein [Mycobacterium sp. 360MFTsu5.1]
MTRSCGSADKRTVRMIFAVTFLWIALLQYVFLGIARGEPYPALILPGFPANCPGCLLETGVPKAKEPGLVVRFADGHAESAPIETILPPGPSVPLIAFSTAYDNDTFGSDPGAIAWLRSKITARFPGREVVGLDIVWRTAIYEAAEPSRVEYAPLRTVSIDFGNAT